MIYDAMIFSLLQLFPYPYSLPGRFPYHKHLVDHLCEPKLFLFPKPICFGVGHLARHQVGRSGRPVPFSETDINRSLKISVACFCYFVTTIGCNQQSDAL